jgi:UPF0042 nucleotide-binding protein
MRNFIIHILTGLSGSGKSTALDVFEDDGFYCVDNMPVALLPKFLEIPVNTASGISGLAFVMDLREPDFLATYPSVFSDLKAQGYRLTVLFFEAGENVLIQRYSQTRRHHPLAGDKGLVSGIRRERELLEELRASSDTVIDTSTLTIHELKIRLLARIRKSADHMPMRIHVMSFGYKHGIPHDADIIMDVRFLPNPYFVDPLKHKNGTDADVAAHVLNHSTGSAFLEKFLNLIDFLLPLYKNEPKAYLTVAVGCTGGCHRSVAVATAVFHHMKKREERHVEISHRDLKEADQTT